MFELGEYMKILDLLPGASKNPIPDGEQLQPTARWIVFDFLLFNQVEQAPVLLSSQKTFGKTSRIADIAK